MRFQSREQAASLLAESLARYRGKNPLVLGIPRGAVPMANIIAEALGGDLDVVLVHKLRAPEQPELAIGAVDEDGRVFLSDYVRALGISATYVQREKQTQLDRLHERRSLYTPHRPPMDATGRTVIVVDDGVATGSTLMAALRALRAKKPARLIAAFAVAPYTSLLRIEAEADETVCLFAPDQFYAVGEFFEDFCQVTDDRVIQILRKKERKRAVGE
ncbi:MAG TPA: phosphoribosyltransferase family protein [Candidatus Binatia bacterium]